MRMGAWIYMHGGAEQRSRQCKKNLWMCTENASAQKCWMKCQAQYIMDTQHSMGGQRCRCKGTNLSIAITEQPNTVKELGISATLKTMGLHNVLQQNIPII